MMFRTEEMEKVRVICLDSDKKNVAESLHKLSIIDLRVSKADIPPDTYMPEYSQLSDMLIKVTGALAIIGKRKGKAGRKEEALDMSRFNPLMKDIKREKILERIYDLSEEKKALEDKKLSLIASLEVVEAFSGLDIKFGKSFSSNVLDFRAFTANAASMASFRNGIKEKKEALDGIEFVVNEPANGRFLVLAVYRKGGSAEFLQSEYKMKEIDFRIDDLSGTPAEEKKKINKDMEVIKKRHGEIEKEYGKIRDAHYSDLKNLEAMLEVQVDKAAVSAIFKKTDKAVVFEGWIARKRYGEFEHAVKTATRNRYHIDKLVHDELAPTLMNRPSFLRPFDYMLEFFSPPRSDEIDPAWIFIISFPIFYGLMVSDVGYGILSFILAWYVTKITDPDGLVYNAAKIWEITAISAAFFGFLSNQYFGLHLNQYFFNFQLFDWNKNITSVIAVSIIFGIVQVTLGLFIGFINKMHRHETMHAISKLTSIIVLLAGTAALSGFLFHIFSAAIVTYTGILAIIMLVVTMAISGMEGIEITNLISHPLSYSRIMGFGLASVILASLIDKAFTPNLGGGIILFAVYLIIFLVLHVLNMILSIFEGMVQGVRLNFVEFFTKFYEGNGTRFKPFGYAYRRRYNKHDHG